jgi:hypothetical protein
MKQVTVTETVFVLGELSNTAREKAIEKMRGLLYEWLDSSQITDHLNGELYSALTARTTERSAQKNCLSVLV